MNTRRAVFGAVLVLIIVVCVLLAILVAIRARRERREKLGGSDESSGDGLLHTPHGHCALGNAILEHQLQFGNGNIQEVTGGDSDSVRDDVRDAVRVTVKRGDKRQSVRPRHWTEFATWESLFKNKKATSQYLKDREWTIREKNFDWSEVTPVVMGKLTESREYIGRINFDPRTKKMVVVEMLPSPTRVGDVGEGSQAFAEIPADFVKRVADKPALFMFHTHPHGGFEFPSPADVVAATLGLVARRFAGDIVVSQYGIHLFQVPPYLDREIARHADPYGHVSKILFDFVSSYNSIRSWAFFSIKSMNSLFIRFRFWCITYPTSKYVATEIMAQDVNREVEHDESLLKRLRSRMMVRNLEQARRRT